MAHTIEFFFPFVFSFVNKSFCLFNYFELQEILMIFRASQKNRKHFLLTFSLATKHRKMIHFSRE